MPSKDKRPIPILFTEEQITRYDRVAEALSVRAAGVRVTRSDAIRTCSERGAALFEEELRIGRRKK